MLRRSGEYYMSDPAVSSYGRLAIGQNGEGRIKSDLVTEAQELEFANKLSGHVRSITKVNTADCMDDRPTIMIGDGTTDKELLAARVVWQLPGGLGLATTKAAVAANAAYLRDARSFKQAYEITSRLITDMGYEDGGHAKCGFSGVVEASVAEPVAKNILLPTVNAILAINNHQPAYFDPAASEFYLKAISQTKQQRLKEGFYGDWSSSWYEDFLQQTVPQNFSFLQGQPDAVHGHYGDAVALFSADRPGIGFAKNDFYETSGQMAFGVTTAPMLELAQKLGGNDQERSRILMGFADDLPSASTHFLGVGMPVLKVV